MAAGIDISKLYGKPGLAKMATVQNRLISIPGEHGQPPRLLKNGEPTSFDAPLEPNDQIHVERGANGKQANVTIKELLGEVPQLSITINETAVEIPATIKCNGAIVQEMAEVQERDVLTIEFPTTVKEILTALHIPLEPFCAFSVTVNGKTVNLANLTNTIRKNGKAVTLEDSVENHDRFEWLEQALPEKATVHSLATALNIECVMKIEVFFNHKPIVLEKQVIEVKKEQVPMSCSDSIAAGDKLTMLERNVEPFILQDIFAKVELELPLKSKQMIRLRKNGQETSFTAPLTNGDHIDLIVDDSKS